MKTLLTALATMALATALSTMGFAQQDQSAQPTTQQPPSDTTQPTADQQSAPQPGSPSQDSMQTTQGSSFTGTVVKADGKYVLKTSDMSYQLDDQKKARQYVGQQVKVMGTLDSSTSTIHISDISPAS